MNNEIQFAAGTQADGWAKNLAEDKTTALLAACIVGQQSAGFGTAVDLRQAACPDCGSAGFNTGWGFFKHLCGAEVVNGEDGGMSEPCGATDADEGPARGPTPEAGYQSLLRETAGEKLGATK